MKVFVREKDFYKSVIHIAAPVVLQNLISIGVNMMDTIMLGRYGEFQLSGSSLGNEFIAVFQIFCMGLGYGAAVLTAQYWGCQKKRDMKKIISIMLRICIAVSVIFSMITLMFPAVIMRCYASDTKIITYGIKYLRISAFTFLPTGLTLTLTAVLRSAREVKAPFIISSVSFGINLFANWIFIFGNMGAPELQIEGAALGTLIARLFEAGAVLFVVFYKDDKIGYRIKDLFGRCGDKIPVYIRYCVPVIISDFLLAIGNTLVSVIIGHIGAAFVAANAIMAQVMRMSTVFTQGVSSASSVMIGNTLGTGDKKKTYEQGMTFWGLGIVIGILAALVILISSPFLINRFEITDETRKIAFELMFAVAFMIVFQSLQSILTKGILRGGGDTRFLMVADILFLWLLSVPLGYFTGIRLHCSAFIVYVSLKSDWVLKSILCTIRLIRGKWMQREAESGE